jgi:hypothetical protein
MLARGSFLFNKVTQEECFLGTVHKKSKQVMSIAQYTGGAWAGRIFLRQQEKSSSSPRTASVVSVPTNCSGIFYSDTKSGNKSQQM